MKAAPMIAAMVEPVAYRKNSSLLVIKGSPGTEPGAENDLPLGDYFYEWKANKLRLIKFVARPAN